VIKLKQTYRIIQDPGSALGMQHLVGAHQLGVQLQVDVPERKKEKQI
jgi:hypothetical protein